jgi:NAD(P)-dependent dehydrogenase (short-subunit alcohol dehydrogenase family)
MSLFDMSGQVALITGSSRGIGKATAEAMAEQGAKVVISSRKQDACDATAAEINARFGEGTAIAVAANISSKDDLQNLVNKTRAAFGKITALVCNAASSPYYGPGLGISDEQFRKTMDNNILSNHWLIAMVAPEMLERGEGSITIISAYSISKAADMQIARNFSVEFGPQGVRVNCVAPGLVRTDMARALWENPDNLKRSTAASTLKRIGEPHEIAGAAVFLASKAGAFTTGQTIVCDGGATISGGA